jgi:hypothetical protein
MEANSLNFEAIGISLCLKQKVPNRNKLYTIFMVEPCMSSYQLIVYYQQMHLMLILLNLKCLKQ